MGDEYIKRIDVLIKLEIAYDMARLDQKLPISDLQHEVNLIKAADVQPVKRGRWFHINNDGFIYCSECNNEAYWDTDYGQQLFDYCPYCGAKMIKDGEQNV